MAAKRRKFTCKCPKSCRLHPPGTSGGSVGRLPAVVSTTQRIVMMLDARRRDALMRARLYAKDKDATGYSLAASWLAHARIYEGLIEEIQRMCGGTELSTTTTA